LPASKERNETLGILTPKIRREIQKTGSMLVNYNPLHESKPHFEFLPNFFRIVFSNPEQSIEDIVFFLDEIDKLGQDITF